eukprot:371966_1
MVGPLLVLPDLGIPRDCEERFRWGEFRLHALRRFVPVPILAHQRLRPNPGVPVFGTVRCRILCQPGAHLHWMVGGHPVGHELDIPIVVHTGVVVVEQTVADWQRTR